MSFKRGNKAIFVVSISVQIFLFQFYSDKKIPKENVPSGVPYCAAESLHVAV